MVRWLVTCATEVGTYQSEPASRSPPGPVPSKSFSPLSSLVPFPPFLSLVLLSLSVASFLFDYFLLFSSLLSGHFPFFILSKRSLVNSLLGLGGIIILGGGC